MKISNASNDFRKSELSVGLELPGDFWGSKTAAADFIIFGGFWRFLAFVFECLAVLAIFGGFWRFLAVFGSFFAYFGRFSLFFAIFWYFSIKNSLKIAKFGPKIIQIGALSAIFWGAGGPVKPPNTRILDSDPGFQDILFPGFLESRILGIYSKWKSN